MSGMDSIFIIKDLKIESIDKMNIRVIIRIKEGVEMKNKKNNYAYPAKVKREKTGITLEFIDFPHLIAVGENEENLIESAQELLALSIIDLISQGKEPPVPSMIEEGTIYIHIWLPYYKNMEKEVYVKKTLTIPAWLDLLAKKNNINFSACLVKGIKDELGI